MVLCLTVHNHKHAMIRLHYPSLSLEPDVFPINSRKNCDILSHCTHMQQEYDVHTYSHIRNSKHRRVQLREARVSVTSNPSLAVKVTRMIASRGELFDSFPEIPLDSILLAPLGFCYQMFPHLPHDSSFSVRWNDLSTHPEKSPITHNTQTHTYTNTHTKHAGSVVFSIRLGFGFFRCCQTKVTHKSETVVELEQQSEEQGEVGRPQNVCRVAFGKQNTKPISEVSEKSPVKYSI